MTAYAEVLRRRRMIRAYDPARPVAPETVRTVVGAALRAPSAGFSQGTSLLVLTEPAERERFWALTAERDTRWLRGMRTAPVLILVWTSQQAYLDRYAETDKGWTDRDLAHWVAPYWYVDAGMAAMATLLAAVDADLGACFFGVPTSRVVEVRAAYAVPTTQLSVGVISLGYPAAGEEPHGSATRRHRRPESELIHWGHWS